MAATDYPDFEGGKQRVYLTPEWAAKEAVDKDFSQIGVGLAVGAGILQTYLVPAGKTLYITLSSGACYAFAAADAELNQIVFAYVRDLTTGAMGLLIGGNGGYFAAFGKPFVVVAGHTLEAGVYNKTNHVANISQIVSGYEV